MIHLTGALADFLATLLCAVLWAAGGTALAAVGCGAAAVGCWRVWRRRWGGGRP